MGVGVSGYTYIYVDMPSVTGWSGTANARI